VSFSLPKFWRFCSNLSINSKEFGVIRLDQPYGPQRWWMRSIAKGLEEGIHDFTGLKCRQIGLSTISLALDLYWPFTHEGLDGTIVTHDEETMVNFRTQLTEYYNSLPKAFKPRSPSHNRMEFVFRFPSQVISRLQYQIAGTRASGNAKLGRAKGNAFLHGTEMAFWGDQAGYQSLRNALAETNPNRLYVWESTANGYNQFEEQWRVARKATTMRAIFVSWWAHEMYRVKRDSAIFKTYWGNAGRLTPEERELCRDVELLYGDAMEFVNGTKKITQEQIAWFRWYSEEKVADADMVMQEMPWTEQQAFVVTGAQYFAARELTSTNKQLNTEGAPSYFRIEIKHTLADCQVIVCPKRVANLWVYAPPVEGAQYVLGADPAYGSSDWADRFVISVWRAYADRLEQVAEYATADCLPYAFAWVMAYMAGCYAPCAWNLEVNGPGAAVLGEIDNLRRQQFAGDPKDRQTMKNFLGGMKEFLYARPDQITRLPTARGTNSTLKEKIRYFATFKDYYARGMLVPHSRELVDEMRWIVQEPGHAPAATGRRKDDRVIGAALACQMWHDKLRANLMLRNVTYKRTEKDPAVRTNIVDQIAARQRALLGVGTPQQQMARMHNRRPGARR
jgi:hypothetical protein